MSCSRWQGLGARAKLTFCGALLDSSIKLNEGERQQLVQKGSGQHLWGLQGQPGCHLRGHPHKVPLTPWLSLINPTLSVALVTIQKKNPQILPFRANLPKLEPPNDWDCHSSPAGPGCRDGVGGHLPLSTSQLHSLGEDLLLFNSQKFQLCHHNPRATRTQQLNPQLAQIRSCSRGRTPKSKICRSKGKGWNPILHISPPNLCFAESAMVLTHQNEKQCTMGLIKRGRSRR